MKKERMDHWLFKHFPFINTSHNKHTHAHSKSKRICMSPLPAARDSRPLCKLHSSVMVDGSWCMDSLTHILEIESRIDSFRVHLDR